jgi:uncharacterized membrane protein YkoI
MKHLAAAGLCIAVLSLPYVILARTVSQAPNYPAADIAAFHGNRKTLRSAIQKIQQTTGGKVVEIRFAVYDGSPGYHAVVAIGGQVQLAFLDHSSKKVVVVNTGPDWALKWQQSTDVQLAESARKSLSQAITAAEISEIAPAIAAGVARSASSPTRNVHAYNVLVDDGGSVKRVAVDSSTGEIINDPEALETWP